MLAAALSRFAQVGKYPACADLAPVIRLIAQLGGFLGRKGDGEPEAKTLWLGLRVAVFVNGMRAMRDA